MKQENVVYETGAEKIIFKIEIIFLLFSNLTQKNKNIITLINSISIIF